MAPAALHPRQIGPFGRIGRCNAYREICPTGIAVRHGRGLRTVADAPGADEASKHLLSTHP
jgi:hypothetical protein